MISFANLIQRSTRKVDHLFRFGGEEFVLLLPDTNLVGLARASENLHRKIVGEFSGAGGPITCSRGAATLRADEGWEAWLARADAALYRAKDAGRNCVVVDGP